MGRAVGGAVRSDSLDVVWAGEIPLETADDVPRPFTENESSRYFPPRFAG
jgi:hypothetical protein